MENRKNGPDRREMMWLGSGVLGFLVILLVLRMPGLDLFDEGEKLRTWVQSFGPLSHLAYIALYVTQVLFAPIPGSIITLMGGYLFGPALGVVYSLIGLGLGATLAVVVARHWGRPLVQRLIGDERISQWERRLHFRSPATWILIFLLPFPDAVFFVAGLMRVPLRWLVLGGMIGRTPVIVASNWLGAQALDPEPPMLFLLLALSGAAWLLIYRFERHLRLHGLLALRRVKHRRLFRLQGER